MSWCGSYRWKQGSIVLLGVLVFLASSTETASAQRYSGGHSANTTAQARMLLLQQQIQQMQQAAFYQEQYRRELQRRAQFQIRLQGYPTGGHTSTAQSHGTTTTPGSTTRPQGTTTAGQTQTAQAPGSTTGAQTALSSILGSSSAHSGKRGTGTQLSAQNPAVGYFAARYGKRESGSSTQTHPIQGSTTAGQTQTVQAPGSTTGVQTALPSTLASFSAHSGKRGTGTQLSAQNPAVGYFAARYGKRESGSSTQTHPIQGSTTAGQTQTAQAPGSTTTGQTGFTPPLGSSSAYSGKRGTSYHHSAQNAAVDSFAARYGHRGFEHHQPHASERSFPGQGGFSGRMGFPPSLARSGELAEVISFLAGVIWGLENSQSLAHNPAIDFLTQRYGRQGSNSQTQPRQPQASTTTGQTQPPQPQGSPLRPGNRTQLPGSTTGGQTQTAPNL